MSVSRSLEGKVALVTGGGVRIGAALTEGLAREGARVLIHHNRSHDGAAQVKRRIERAGGTAWLLEADFGDAGQAERTIASGVDVAGGIDILINNASTYPQEDWAQADGALFHDTLQINSWAPLALMRAFSTTASPGACVVNILDTHLHALTREKFVYQLSKHALAFLTRYAALAAAPALRVNAVAPGAILPPPGEGAPYLQQLGQTLPLRRHGSPNDVLDAVLFLTRSPFVTGVTIEVDGGEHLLGIPCA